MAKRKRDRIKTRLDMAIRPTDLFVIYVRDPIGMRYLGWLFDGGVDGISRWKGAQRYGR